MGVEKAMDNDDDTTMLDDLFGPESDDDTDAAKVAPPPEPSSEARPTQKRSQGLEPVSIEADAGRVPVTLNSPIKPSATDVDKHYVTHLPFRNWCPVCNGAKMKGDPHVRLKESDDQSDRKSGLPIISMDYQEFDKVFDNGEEAKPEAATPKIKTIVIKDERTTSVLFHKVIRKGPSDEWVIKRIAKDINEWGRQDIILKTDGEPAMIAVQDAIAQVRKGQTIPMNPPAYNPEANGACEKAVQDVNAHVRALKLGLEARLNATIDDNSAIMEWIVPHAAHLLSKYSAGHDGMTPHERMTGRRWRRPVVEIGEVVLAK